ncbi:MAG TPA: hypothetical protein VEF33_11755 [Syntrophales bacterium]|nr:hypothetical protein [Syntrophales bacterium]
MKQRNLEYSKKFNLGKTLLVVFILGIIFFFVIPMLVSLGGAVLGFVSIIGPERSVDIIYPADNAEVPMEVHVACLSTFRVGGIVDHSSHVYGETSRVNLTNYGLKGSLFVDGKERLTSNESGTMHIYKLKLEEGQHDITFSTLLGSKTIRVLAKKDLYPGFTEIAYEKRPDVPVSEKGKECNIGIKIDREYIYATFNGRAKKYSIKDIPVIRKGAQLVYPDDKSMAESLRCYGDHAVAVLAEMDGVPSDKNSDTQIHHFLAYFNKENTPSFIDLPSGYSAFRRDINVYVTEKGNIILNERAGQIYYRAGNDWKKIYMPVVLANTNDTVCSTFCGSPTYNASEAKYLQSSGVSFKPCYPEFDIFMYRGKTFVESRAIVSLYEKKLYQIIEK